MLITKLVNMGNAVFAMLSSPTAVRAYRALFLRNYWLFVGEFFYSVLAKLNTVSHVVDIENRAGRGAVVATLLRFP